MLDFLIIQGQQTRTIAETPMTLVEMPKFDNRSSDESGKAGTLSTADVNFVQRYKPSRGRDI